MSATALKTRRPTGQPSWPIVLLAGGEKAGKSWACAVASASDLIGRTLWVGVGEDDPDEYGQIPGADFEIVEHEGSYRSILDAITAAVSAPIVDGRPTLIVVDSMTRIWDLLKADAQETANGRARVKAEKYRKPIPAEDVQITMDLWNVAKDRWGHVMDTLRSHQGPVLVTARLEEVTVMDSQGKPTTEKNLKVQAEKSLPYDVGAIVEMPQRGQTWLRGVRSVRLPIDERLRVDDFTVDTFWRKLGLEGQVGDRRHSGIRPDAGERRLQAVPASGPPADRDWLGEIAAAADRDALGGLWREAAEAGVADGLRDTFTARAQALASGPDEPRREVAPETVAAAEASWGDPS